MHINELLQMAMNDGASDLHLTINSPPVFRINGKLVRLNMPLLNYETLVELIKGTMNSEQMEKFTVTGELDFAYSIRGLGRFRVNAFKQRGMPSLVARVIPGGIKSIEELGLPSVMKEIALKPNGLILVTGPTGSGKTTSLAAIIDLLNHKISGHIITLEDPIEYLHTHNSCIVNQREIGLDSQCFATALRAALRQDPDVILVGEMRDLETISTAITAAETGHLVLATLHTASAIQTIDRIIDVFPPHQQEQIRMQLSLILQGIFAQQLLPNINQDGRIIATEVLIANPAVRNIIREGKTPQLITAMQSGAKFGMHTMDQSLRRLLENRLIAYEEAVIRAADRESFQMYQQGY